MDSPAPATGPMKDPVAELAAYGGDDAVLAIITGTEGPSYRPVGAVMAIFGDHRRVGTLSSGCIESDLALHALEALQSGRPTPLRYGRGSPFVDIQLPCGGGLEILLVPRPDREVLRALAERREARAPCTLAIDRDSGALSLRDTGETGAEGTLFLRRFLPEIRFLVFGKGPEASTFAGLVQSAGYPNVLVSPDVETLDHGSMAGSATHHLVRPDLPETLAPDDRTAIVLFFHDHEWEPPILEKALKTPAFYIGAQGSQRARDARLLELEAMGVDRADFSRLRGPVGLIPSVRDARTLAVSVLAEVLAEAARV